jgi:hypothetical protein
MYLLALSPTLRRLETLAVAEYSLKRSGSTSKALKIYFVSGDKNEKIAGINTRARGGTFVAAVAAAKKRSKPRRKRKAFNRYRSEHHTKTCKKKGRIEHSPSLQKLYKRDQFAVKVGNAANQGV